MRNIHEIAQGGIDIHVGPKKSNVFKDARIAFAGGIAAGAVIIGAGTAVRESLKDGKLGAVKGTIKEKAGAIPNIIPFRRRNGEVQAQEQEIQLQEQSEHAITS